ncbi:MAG: TonB-dependent receptor plug domain-containing protein [Thermonemataceae bacterium]|nr:TonB-dependent receptor plug domain-containing protein [Thermonemataceae bacterium]
MKKNLLLGFVMVFLLAFQAFAQTDVTISGKVTDSKGEPVPGASVYVKGNTSVGTITDANGSYTLTVPSGSRLIITAVGLQTQEIGVGSEPVINVKMAEEDAIGEVVVTAVGIKRQPKELGYSVTQIKAENLNQAKAINTAVGLSGKAAGLQINQTTGGVNPNTRIVLRGNRSLTGNNQALVVLDGSVVPQSVLTNLNPNDIESVNILKGANAAAIYGADAANGVIVVTTKKGGDKFSATLSHTNMIEQVSFLPSFQNQFGAGTFPYSQYYIPYENQSYGPAFGTNPVIGYDGTVYDGNAVVLGKKLEDGTYQTAPYQALPNEKKEVWDIGSMMQTEVSLSGGNKNSKFYLSFQDLNQKGVVPKDKYRRNSFRLNASTEAGKLQAGFNVNYT